MIATVIGLGKMGLPFAVYCTRSEIIEKVFGVDVDQKIVDQINSGQTILKDEPSLVEGLRDAISSKKLEATLDTRAAISSSDVVVVLVPVYVDKDGKPEFSRIDSATLAIGSSIKPGTLVCYETTLPVGTTRDRFTKKIEDISGLIGDKDFFVCFSPERVSSGTVFEDFARYPKLVGGIGPASEAKAVEFYNSVFNFIKRNDLLEPNGVWSMGSCEAAELAKLAETTYRDVNIALANQFAKFADNLGLDFYRIINACNSQPFSHIHKPGIAVGGHCIPVYPKMYLLGDPNGTLVQEARQVNESMPDHFVAKLVNYFGGDLLNKRVIILGLSYREGVKEVAFSGAFGISKALGEAGASVKIHDPLFADHEIKSLGFSPHDPGEIYDAAILHTWENSYKENLLDICSGIKVFVDGRNHLQLSGINFGDIDLIGLGIGESN